MTDDSLARDLSADGEPNDPIYDALVAALRSSARGRAFLEEHARRARASDTAAALAALARIEALLQNDRTESPVAVAHETEPRIDPDNAYVPFEFEPLPDTGTVSDVPPAPSRSADLIVQVMALSPEERIALFS